jgi:hypothetical protein
MKKQIAFLTVLIALSACSNIPKSAYFTRGQPETLLEVTDQVVDIDVSSRNGIGRLNNAIKSNNPSSAVLSCSNQMLCNEAAAVLDRNNVPYDRQRGMGNKVTLSYSEVEARDCESAFITNHNNPYNLNHPTFGCSIAVNQVQMVSDKRQFTDPLLLGPYDGQKATQNYDSYLSRSETTLNADSAASAGASQ